MDDPIRHVVVLMLENNSFDRMLGCMKAVFPDLEGVDPSSEPSTNPDFPDASHLFGQLPDAGFTVHGIDRTDALRRVDRSHQCKEAARPGQRDCDRAEVRRDARRLVRRSYRNVGCGGSAISIVEPGYGRNGTLPLPVGRTEKPRAPRLYDQ
jgi:Phosphoesterase family